MNTAKILNMLFILGETTKAMGNKWHVFTEEETNTILSMWDSGLSRAKIGRAVELDVKKVSRCLEQNGRQLERRQRGDNHGLWQGGKDKYFNGYKYVWIPVDHPFRCMVSTACRVAEHRLVMAQHLGRPLEPYEAVHHKNGIRDDNRIENLQLVNRFHKQGFVARCRCCGSYELIFEELTDDAVDEYR